MENFLENITQNGNWAPLQNVSWQPIHNTVHKLSFRSLGKISPIFKEHISKKYIYHLSYLLLFLFIHNEI